MPTKTKIKPGQNLIDFAVQHYGTAESILKLCLDNNLNIGQDVEPETELLIDENYTENSENVNFYKTTNKNVATANEPIIWILETGIWYDSGIWYDTKTWIDR